MPVAASCPAAPDATVRVYELEGAYATWHWLCRVCLGKRLKNPHVYVKTNRTPAFGDLACEDCGKVKKP
jgi:hypothetical protein